MTILLPPAKCQGHPGKVGRSAEGRQECGVSGTPPAEAGSRLSLSPAKALEGDNLTAALQTAAKSASPLTALSRCP